MARAEVFQAVLFFALIFAHQGAIIESKSMSSITRNSASKQDQPKKSGSSVSHAGKAPRKSRVKPLCAHTLPKKYINDDFCDCLVDGSDEPGRQIKLDYSCLSFVMALGFFRVCRYLSPSSSPINQLPFHDLYSNCGLQWHTVRVRVRTACHKRGRAPYDARYRTNVTTFRRALRLLRRFSKILS